MRLSGKTVLITGAGNGMGRTADFMNRMRYGERTLGERLPHW